MSALLTADVIRGALQSIKPLFFPSDGGAGMLLSCRTLAISVIPNEKTEFHATWGDLSNEKADKYIKFAHRKARLARKHQMDTLHLRNLPHLLEEGDVGWPGGVYRYGGIAVGVSGLDWHNDHMVAAMIAEVCFAMSMKTFRQSETDPSFLGSIPTQ